MIKIKKGILSLFILVSIIISLIVCLMLYMKNEAKKAIDMPDEKGWEPTYEINKTLQFVEIRNNYYIAQNCIEKFYMYYSELFANPLDGDLIKPDEETIDLEAIKRKNAKKVYKILDEEYIEFKGITLENITTKLTKLEDVSIHIQNMYYVEKEENISAYFVYGKLKENLTSMDTDFSIMLKIDRKNSTYKVLLDDYVKTYFKDIALNKEVEFHAKSQIEDNVYNRFTYEHVSDQEYVNDLFKHYKNNLKNNKENTYNLLDEKYKSKVFSNLEEYVIYMNSNYSKILSAKLDSYNKEKSNDYTKYIFKDSDNKYYVFIETAPFQYTVMLDNYTIPTNDFIETYNSSTEVEKVILNIKRFFMGIDDKNYGYSYSVLSEAFKAIKYPSKEKFIEYVKKNFFEENEIEYISYEKQNGLYIYKINIKDATGKSTDSKSLNIIVKLNNGTDFEMSFGTN